MRRFCVTLNDGREFHITASDRWEAKRRVFAMCYGRVSLDEMSATEMNY